MPEVKKGQVWEEADPRAKGRRFRIKYVWAVYAEVVTEPPLKPRTSLIRLGRFRDSGKRGYRLIEDAG